MSKNEDKRHKKIKKSRNALKITGSSINRKTYEEFPEKQSVLVNLPK